ncbi:MAG: L-histidine N(alpha)-methyltransferase [Acidobacteriaceae bacterium]
MATNSRVQPNTHPTALDIGPDVVNGLSASPKWLSSKLFYDAEGSRLFDAITELPEYYLTRTEASILRHCASAITAHAARGERLSIVELGAGSAAKTTLVLKAVIGAQRRVNYYPLDVSRSALDDAAVRLHSELPACTTLPICADYKTGMSQLRQIQGRKLVLYIGSSIGNFEPMEGVAILADLRRNLSAGDAVLLGTDMRKSPDVIVPAYDDAQGITAAFNKNILAHINRELGADFDLDLFMHRVIWNSDLSRIEMHLESLIPHAVSIPALRRTVQFASGETIHTEDSYKFTLPVIDSICKNAGLTREQTWSDPQNWFTVHLLRA